MADRSKLYPVEIPSFPLRPSREGMSRRTRVRLSFALAALLTAVVVAAVLLAVFSPGRSSLLRLGAQAPAFDLHTAAGARIASSTLRGKPVLLVFCGTWSSACARQMPVLNAIAAAHRGAAVLLLDGDSENAQSVAAFGRQFHARFPLLLDPGTRAVSFPDRGPRGPVTARYRVTTFPTFYVVGPGGRIAWHATGVQTQSALERGLRAAGRPVP